MWLLMLSGATEQGLLYGLMAIGVYLTFRVLNYADLTVDGSFALGASISARLIFDGGDPWVATALAAAGGIAAGMATGFLHTKLKIAPLLAGILSMTALYSVNLRVMGRANVPLLGVRTIVSDVTGALPAWLVSFAALFLGGVAVALAIFGLNRYLHTEAGLALQATGDNERMSRSLGINTDRMKIVGLALSNGLVAVSGALVAQYQGFADAGMGIGTIIAGLASVIIGEALLGSGSVARALVAAMAGSLIYRLAIALVLRLGLAPTDLKLLTALLVIVALASPRLKARLRLSSVVAATGDVNPTGDANPPGDAASPAVGSTSAQTKQVGANK